MSHGKFRFQIIFTGICGYVEKDRSMKVVLPQAPATHSSIDGQPLDEHRSALFFLEGKVQKVIPLEGTEVKFTVTGATNKFDVEDSFRQYVTPMAALSPQTKIDDKFLTGTDPNVVAARVEFKADGRIGVTGPNEPWRFRPPLFGMPNFDNRILRNEVFVDFGFVKAAEFSVCELDGTEVRGSAHIPIHDATKACVIIANLERLDQDDRGIDVARCSIGNALTPKRDDLSFRWHYEMLKEKSKLVSLCDYDEFGRRYAPYPTKNRKSAEAGSGPNCYGARFTD